MKLRLKGSSVRLRLGPGEVDRLVRAGSVVEMTRFGPGAALGYALCADPDITAPAVTFAAGQLRVLLPAATVQQWAGSADQVEIRADLDTGDGHRLWVLVEKDFECLHGEERETDVYSRPERSGVAAPSKGLAGMD